MCKKKMATSAEMLCRYTPPAFRQFTEGVVNQKFDEEPKYEAYMKLFEPLCGPAPQRPILTEGATKVGVLQSYRKHGKFVGLARSNRDCQLGILVIVLQPNSI